MRLGAFVAFFLNAFQTGFSAPEGAGACTPVTQLQRREWRTLSTGQKKEYIDAVKCLQERPAITTFEAVRTRFDDFQALHISLTDRVHLVGHFLPWHRRFLATYEQALREECRYEGANPYWDWSLDSQNFSSLLASPIFSPTTGFGSSDPRPPNHVLDGPFAGLTLFLGPGNTVNTHTLTRALNETLLPYVTHEQVQNTTRQPTFELFRIELEGRPVTDGIKIHDGGHRLIGGDLGDTYSSPGDPLFYLHHANLDRIWWIWQKVDLKKRLYDMSGRSTVDPPYQNVTLDFQLEMANLADRVPIRDVMNVMGELLCYDYD